MYWEDVKPGNLIKIVGVGKAYVEGYLVANDMNSSCLKIRMGDVFLVVESPYEVEMNLKYAEDKLQDVVPVLFSGQLVYIDVEPTASLYPKFELVF